METQTFAVLFRIDMDRQHTCKSRDRPSYKCPNYMHNPDLIIIPSPPAKNTGGPFKFVMTAHPFAGKQIVLE